MLYVQVKTCDLFVPSVTGPVGVGPETSDAVAVPRKVSAPGVTPVMLPVPLFSAVMVTVTVPPVRAFMGERPIVVMNPPTPSVPLAVSEDAVLLVAVPWNTIATGVGEETR